MIALTAGTAALTLARAPAGLGRRGRAVAARRGRPRRRGPRGAGGAARRLARRRHRGRELPARDDRDLAVRDDASPLLRRGLLAAARHPQRVLVVAAALAICGWALDARIGIVSDLPRLVPQDLAAVRDLDALQRDTGVAGEVDVLVEAGPHRPEGHRVDARLPERHPDPARLRPGEGLRRRPSCARRSRCPTSSARRSCRPRASRSARCWTPCPPYFSQAAITPDRRTAVLAFGLRLQSLEAQHEVIEDMRARLNPPDGVRATVAGLPVLAADANHALSDPLRRRAARARGAGRRSRWRCSRSTARGRGRGCRWSRSRWPRAGRRSCCGCSACR